MDAPYICMEHVSFSYDEGTNEKKYILKNVDFSVKKGDFVAILGRNGSGKSTLAKLINAILVPDEGKILVDGVDVTSPDLSDEELLSLRRKVGMVFQNPDNQLVATVVEEDVAFGPENLGYPPAEIRQRVNEAMALLGVSEFARHAPTRLSGGQKQRVAIAGLLAMRPKCMIFDEATSMLDPLGREEVMKIILKLNKEMGITVLHITHNMEEVVAADRVVVMDNGKFILDGSPKEVFSHVETMHRVGLNVPEGTELLYELSKSGAPLQYDLLSEEECANAILELYQKRAQKSGAH